MTDNTNSSTLSSFLTEGETNFNPENVNDWAVQGDGGMSIPIEQAELDARQEIAPVFETYDAAPFAMEAPVPPLLDASALFAELNTANAVQQTLDGLIHPSIVHALHCQQLLSNMRMMQSLAQNPNLHQILYGNMVAAASALNLQGGLTQEPLPSHFIPFPNFGHPLFPGLAAPVTGTYEPPYIAAMFPGASLMYDPVGYLGPQQEYDFDAQVEERKPYGQRCLLYLVEERHWVEALQRISTHPQEASMVGMQGRAPLHLACDHDAPAFLVHALLSVWPEGADMVGTSKMNPLHITCSSQHASNEIVNLLLSGCRDPLRITCAKDVDGDTPLHAACRCAAPIDVIATLLQTNPGIVMWHDYEGLNPLLRLWVRYYVMLGESVISSIARASDLTAELVEAWQKSLLLLRVMNEVDKTSSRACSSRDHYPVHVSFRAVHTASSVECPRCVLRIATILYPDQLLIANEDGNLPLHIATKAPVYRVHDLGGEGFSIEDAFFEQDEFNRRSTIQDGEIIYSNKNDEDDSENPLNEPSVIDILLNVAPSVARMPDPSGQLPLHSAVDSGKTFEQGLKGLVEAYPEAIMIPDAETKLYPFMLAATAGGDVKNCSTIFELMRLTPEVVKMGLSDDMDLQPKAKPKPDNNGGSV